MEEHSRHNRLAYACPGKKEKKDPTFKKVMETQKELKDSEGFDRLESTELAIDKQKFLLNRLYEKRPIPQDQD